MSRFGAGGGAQPLGGASSSPIGDFRNLCDGRTRFARLDEPVRLERGALLEGVEVAYRTWGEPSSRAILVCHALTGSADVDDWWPGLLDDGGPLDPARHFVVASNVLGGCYGTTGPSRVHADGDLIGLRFPEVTIRDMVRVQERWLRQLGVETLAAVVGGSMGGMQVLEWAAMFPDMVERIAPVAVSARHSPWCIGFSQSQRRALAADPRWSGGVYATDRRPLAGLEVARQIAMISYRSPTSFDRRFARRRNDGGAFEVESYLDHHGERLRGRFDPATYYRLTQAMDTHDLGRGRGERGAVEEVLVGLDLPALVVGVDSDVLYPLDEQRFLAEHLPRCELVVVRSDHGHDGFLIEQEQLGAALERFLRAG